MTPTTTIDPDRHSQLLHRVFDLPGHGLTPDRARWLLDLDFPDADQARIELLNGRATVYVLGMNSPFPCRLRFALA